MKIDGIKLLGQSSADNFTIVNGPTLPVEGNNVGELFYLTTGQTGLYVYNPGGWARLGGTAWGSITGTLSNQTDLWNALQAKAPIANPTFTGTVSGVTKAMVGLGNVDNTSDANKPVSTATNTALDLKVAKSGDFMTGNLTISSSGDTVLRLNKTSDLEEAALRFSTNSTVLWSIGLLPSSSNLTVSRYSGGAFFNSPISLASDALTLNIRLDPLYVKEKWAIGALVGSSVSADPTVNGSITEVQLNANTTLVLPTPSFALKGVSLTVMVKQNATTARTLTWPTTVRWPGGGTNSAFVVLPTTLGLSHAYTLLCDGSFWLGTVAATNYTR